MSARLVLLLALVTCLCWFAAAGVAGADEIASGGTVSGQSGAAAGAESGEVGQEQRAETPGLEVAYGGDVDEWETWIVTKPDGVATYGADASLCGTAGAAVESVCSSTLEVLIAILLSIL